MSSLWKLWAHLKALWKFRYFNLLSNDSISSSYLFCDQGRPPGQFHLWDRRELCRPVRCHWQHHCLWLSQEDVCSGPSFTLFSACSSSINDVKLAYPTIGGIKIGSYVINRALVQFPLEYSFCLFHIWQRFDGDEHHLQRLYHRRRLLQRVVWPPSSLRPRREVNCFYEGEDVMSSYKKLVKSDVTMSSSFLFNGIEQLLFLWWNRWRNVFRRHDFPKNKFWRYFLFSILSLFRL